MSNNIMSEPVIIGVDHGYAAMKSSHFSFPTGLVAYEYEPYTSKMCWNTAENIMWWAAGGSRCKETRP